MQECQFTGTTKGRTSGNNRRWGDNSPPKISCKWNWPTKKILQAVIPKNSKSICPRKKFVDRVQCTQFPDWRGSVILVTGLEHRTISLLDQLYRSDKALNIFVPHDDGTFLHRAVLYNNCSLYPGMYGNQSSGSGSDWNQRWDSERQHRKSR